MIFFILNVKFLMLFRRQDPSILNIMECFKFSPFESYICQSSSSSLRNQQLKIKISQNIFRNVQLVWANLTDLKTRKNRKTSATLCTSLSNEYTAICSLHNIRFTCEYAGWEQSKKWGKSVVTWTISALAWFKVIQKFRIMECVDKPDNIWKATALH